MATQVVELTGDEASLLRSLDKLIAKEVEHERTLGRLAESGDAAGTQLEAAMGRVQRANDQALSGMIRDLAKLGPEGKAAAESLKSNLAEGGRIKMASVDGLLGDIAKLDPASAEAAAKVRLELAAADEASRFDNTLRELAQIDPAAAQAARGIKTQMSDADKSSKFDTLVAEIRKADPAAAEAAVRIRQEIAEADAASRFDNTLRELAKVNPEAAKAAGRVRTEMSDADKAVKFDGIISELEKLDPKAAAEAKKLKDRMNEAAEGGTVSWRKFATSTVAQIGGVVTAYVGVQQAVQQVNEYLEKQRELSKSAAESQRELAKAQAETLKNLVGLTAIQQNELLNEAIPQILQSSGTSDGRIIAQALGGAVSGGATPEQAKDAVLNSAIANRLTPEKIGSSASAAIDLGKATGTADTRANLALLLSTGTQSRIEDPLKLAQNLAPSLTNAVATVPGQDQEEATRQAAGLFAVLTQAATDTSGEKSRTATIQFTSELGKFFGDLEKQTRDSRSELQKLEKKIEGGSATESDLFRKGQIQQFLAEAEGVTDPVTISGRLQLLQQNEGFRGQFFSREFGEQQFKLPFRQLADSNSELAKLLDRSTGMIQTDVAGFASLVNSQQGITPQLRSANAMAIVEGGLAAQRYGDIELGRLNDVRQIATTVLEQTRPEGFSGFIASWRDEFGIQSGMTSGSTSAEEGVMLMAKLFDRMQRLPEDSISQIQTLQTAIDQLRILVTSDPQRLNPRQLANAQTMAEIQSRIITPDPAEKEFFRELADEFRAVRKAIEAQTPILQKTAGNTEQGPPNYHAISQRAFAEDDSR